MDLATTTGTIRRDGSVTETNKQNLHRSVRNVKGLRAKLHRACVAYVEQRIDTLNSAMAEVKEAADEETKNSAGDKYETGRAMMQIEMEKHAAQLAEAKKLQKALKEISLDENANEVQPGSVVFTNHETFYISIGAGALTVDGIRYFAVSPSSPIGMKLIGCKPGDQFELNKRKIQIARLE
jgi:transcription elongation GreA/GreB family factor